MIPVNQPLLGKREKALVAECIDSGWISSEGPFVREFESRMAVYLGVEHAIAVSSGTAALELAVEALDLAPQTAVVLPAFTIISCALAVVRSGLTPVLVDVDPETWCMDMDQLARVLSGRSDVRAVMPVHIYGHPCDMDPLSKLAESHRLSIVEDAAEVHGARYRGCLCGALGDVGVFSFYANKIVSTGEGGMCVTDSGQLADRIRSLRNLCFRPEKRFEHLRMGYNYRLTNLQAAVGVAQMERIEDLVSLKRRQGEAYRRRLGNIDGIRLQTIKPWCDPVYWVTGIVLDDAHPLDAEGLAARLLAEGVQTRPFFWPIHEQPVLRGMGYFSGERYPVAERLARRGLYLPGGMALTEAQLDTVCNALTRCL